MIDKELIEQFELLTKGMARMEERLSQQLKEEVRGAETRINVKIENSVSRKIEALFDGYKLTHEKQWELERRVDELERKLVELQGRIA